MVDMHAGGESLSLDISAVLLLERGLLTASSSAVVAPWRAKSEDVV